MVATARGQQRQGLHWLALPEWAWAGALVCAFALYYFAPGLPLSVLLLALCAVLCYAQLPLAVGLVPLAMPFYMLPKHLGHEEFALGETAIVLCAAAFLLRRVLEPAPGDTAASSPGGTDRALFRRFIPASPLEGAVALFLIAATLATLFAHYRHFALRQYRETIVEPIAYYVLVVALLRDTRAMTRALWAVAGAGALVALLGLGQYLFRYNTLSGATWVGNSRELLHQVTAVYGSPNNLGLLLDRAIPVAVVAGLGAIAVTRAQRAGKPTWHTYLPYLPWLAVVPMAAALALSGSRGGMITAVAVSIIAALLWYGRRDRRLELAALVVVVVGAAAVLWKFRHGLSTLARIHVWESALRMIRDHPLFGIGPDNFLYYYVNPKAVPANPAVVSCPAGIARMALPSRHYMDMVHAWQEPCLSHPHNVILDAWLSTGLLGLVALALLVGGFALLAVRNLRRLKWGPARLAQIACAAVVVATLAHGMVDNSIFLPDLAVFFWLALALTGNLQAASPAVQ